MIADGQGLVRAGLRVLLEATDTEGAEVVRAVELLAHREGLLPPRGTHRLIAQVQVSPEAACPDPELLDELTAREREVVALVGNGLTNDEIAPRPGQAGRVRSRASPPGAVDGAMATGRLRRIGP